MVFKVVQLYNGQIQQKIFFGTFFFVCELNRKINSFFNILAKVQCFYQKGKIKEQGFACLFLEEFK